MTTSIRVDEDTKALIEALQAEIKLIMGKRVTQQEVLARMVKRIHHSRKEFVESFQKDYVPLTRKQIERFHSGMISSGASTKEDDIDETLYGSQS